MDIFGFFLISLLCLCIYYFFGIKFSSKKLPPGPRGYPILGSLLTIGNMPHESLANLAKIHGPLMTVKFGMVSVVVASSIEMVKEILQKNDQVFLGRPTPEGVKAEKCYDMSMGWSQGHSLHWKRVRKISSVHLFTNQRLDILRQLRKPTVEKMMEQVGKSRDKGEAVYIDRLVFGTMLNMLSNTMLYSDMYDCTSDATRELQVLIANLMENAARPNVADFLPFLKPFDPQGIRKRVKVSYDGLHKLFDRIIGERIKLRASETTRCGDFLDVLLDYTEEHDHEEFNVQKVKILLMDLFNGGTHSTTATVEWAMTELLRNPPILAALKQELSHHEKPKKIIEEEDIPNFPYLNAVIKEAMRLHPIAPLLLPHKAQHDVELCGKYFIPKHTQVFINAWSILHDPLYWPEPTCFKPDRFLDSGMDFQGRDFCFIPFGAGRRSCPGSNLAIRMISVILANLVSGFDWKLENGLKAEDMDMKERFGITLQKAQPLVAIPL